jgi:hypothetical protein
LDIIGSYYRVSILHFQKKSKSMHATRHGQWALQLCNFCWAIFFDVFIYIHFQHNASFFSGSTMS